MPQIAIHTLTAKGLELAMRLRTSDDMTVFTLKRLQSPEVQSFESFTQHIAEVFNQFDGHVFITAAGIAVRCIAPHLKGKDVDPAVVVLDQEGKFAVSLLSGHLGGANELAEQCADVIGGQAVITTATDSAGLPSLDMMAKEEDMAIGNLDRVKVVNAALLDGKSVQVYDPGDYLKIKRYDQFTAIQAREEWKVGEPGVWVSWKEDCLDDDALRLYPPVLMLGVGCRRGTPREEITAHIDNVLQAANLALDSLAGLASVDLKADEEGLLESALELGVEPEFYEKQRLDAVEAPNPSGAVMDRIGIASVSEASALLLSEGGELLVEKTKTKTVTLAVARRR